MARSGRGWDALPPQPQGRAARGRRRGPDQAAHDSPPSTGDGFSGVRRRGPDQAAHDPSPSTDDGVPSTDDGFSGARRRGPDQAAHDPSPSTDDGVPSTDDGLSGARRRNVLSAVEALARQLDIASTRGAGSGTGEPEGAHDGAPSDEQPGRGRSESARGNGRLEDGRPGGEWPASRRSGGARARGPSGSAPDGQLEDERPARGPDEGEWRAGRRAGGSRAARGQSGGEGPDGGGRGGRREPSRAGEEAPRDEHEVAREICLKQLSVRPRTRAELAKALHKQGISDEVAGAVLNRYDEVGLIDDAAFAKAWVNSRHHGRGLASRALAQELRQRGVSPEHTEEALSGLDADTEAETALALATRKLRTMRGEPESVFRRLVGMLARKGYPAGVAVRAVKEALATRDAEAAELIDPDAYEDE